MHATYAELTEFDTCADPRVREGILAAVGTSENYAAVAAAGSAGSTTPGSHYSDTTAESAKVFAVESSSRTETSESYSNTDVAVEPASAAAADSNKTPGS